MRRFGVFALIHDKAGKLLLVKQRRNRKSWSLPGGKLQLRERVLDGLVREVKEETGLIVKPLELAMVINREAQNYIVFIFDCRVLKKTRFSVQKSTEIAAVEFFNLQKLPTPLSVQAAACIFRLKKDKKGYTPFVEIEEK